MHSLSFIVSVVLASLSLPVWGLIATRWSRGLPALEQLPRNRSPWLSVACGAAAVYVVTIVVINFIARIPPRPASIDTLIWASTIGCFEILVALALLTGSGRASFAECGMNHADLGRQVRDGFLGYLASWGPVFLVLLATLPIRTEETQHPFLKLLANDGSPEVICWLLVSAAVVAPIKEELIFRVMLQDGLARRIGSPAAIGIVSVLFCAVHGFPDSLALLPLAVILGYVYDRRQSVLSVVLIHTLFNLTNIAIMLLDST